MKRPVHYLILFFFILCKDVAQGQQPFVKNYRLNEKETDVKINDIVQDSIGYLWLATDDGLVRYNGLEFVNIPDKSPQPISELALIGAALYLGHEDGSITIAENSKVWRPEVQQYSGNSRILKINGTKSDWWLATEDGLWRVRSNTATAFRSVNGLSDNYSYDINLSSGNALIATDKGITQLQTQPHAKVFSILNSGQGLRDNIVTDIAFSGSPQLFWTGTQTAGVQLLHLAEQRFYNSKSDTDWKWGEVTDIKRLDNTSAIASTGDGYLILLKLLPGNTFESVVYAHLNTAVNCVFVDKTANIWCGTNQGLTLILSNYFSHYTIHGNYRIADLGGISYDLGKIWMAQGNQLFLYDLTNGSWRPAMLLPVPVSNLYTDSRHTLWIGTMGKGLFYKYPDSRLQHLDLPELKGATILSMVEYHGEIWISGLNGLDRIGYDKVQEKYVLLQHFSKDDGIGSDYVYYLYKDRQNHLWIASDGAGIRCFDGSQFRSWPQLSKGSAQIVYCITEDHKGNIWFADADNQLYQQVGDQWRSYRMQGNKRNNEISALIGDNNGFILSVYRDRIDYLHLLRNQQLQFELDNWLPADSFSSALNCYTKDENGNIYLPVSSGLLMLRNLQLESLSGQRIIIQKMTNNGKEIEAGVSSFRASQNDFGFQFDAIFFSDASKFYYRYRLDGNNSNWVYTDAAYATFANLQPGKYRFIVQSATNPQFQNYAEAYYDFHIAHPLWQRWWFILLLLTVVTTTIYFYNRRRVQQLQRIAAIKQERLFFEYEYLRSQINPHFLFNSLNTLTALIEEDTGKAMRYTEKLSDLYRNTINRLEKNLISLTEELDILKNYVDIQRYRFGSSLIVNIQAEDALIRAARIVPMALQFLVENALKHNVASRKEPLVVDILIDEQKVVVRNRINRKRHVMKESQLGLRNIEKRYAEHTNQRMSYREEGEYWVVELPLVK